MSKNTLHYKDLPGEFSYRAPYAPNYEYRPSTHPREAMQWCAKTFRGHYDEVLGLKNLDAMGFCMMARQGLFIWKRWAGATCHLDPRQDTTSPKCKFYRTEWIPAYMCEELSNGPHTRYLEEKEKWCAYMIKRGVIEEGGES